MVAVQPGPIDKVPRVNNSLTLPAGNGRRGGSHSLPMISPESIAKIELTVTALSTSSLVPLPCSLCIEVGDSDLPPPQLLRPSWLKNQHSPTFPNAPPIVLQSPQSVNPWCIQTFDLCHLNSNLVHRRIKQPAKIVALSVHYACSIRTFRRLRAILGWRIISTRLFVTSALSYTRNMPMYGHSNIIFDLLYAVFIATRLFVIHHIAQRGVSFHLLVCINALFMVYGHF